MTQQAGDAINGTRREPVDLETIRPIVEEVYEHCRSLRGGHVADYIPELAGVNPELFSICICTVDGDVLTFGDAEYDFTIQSVSKPFLYGQCLEDHGYEAVERQVGVEPTGDAFNSLIRLDEKSNRPHNPMVNAGAIAMTNMFQGENSAERLNRMMELFRKYTGRRMYVDLPTYLSEKATGHRNRAISYLMANFGMLQGDLEASLDLYFQQCALLVTTRDLAVMGATLANNGCNPLTEEQAVSAVYVRDILSVMLTCGLYDYSGEWVYRVGVPAKSGVGGGLLAAVPNRMGIGIFSPPLDDRGNPYRAVKACELLSRKLHLHIFDDLNEKRRR